MQQLIGGSRGGRVARAGAVLVVLAIATFGLATSVSAQSGPTADCTGDAVVSFGSDFFGAGSEEVSLWSLGTTMRTFDLPAPLAAGEYQTNGVSYDGYPNRAVITPQLQEQWYAEYLAADGTVLAITGTTGDLQDAVDEATWSGALGSITLADTATQIRTVHAAPGADGVNSVRPVCVGATLVVPEPEIPPSSVTVTFQDEDPEASTIELDCGGTSESATGRLVQLRLADLPGGSSCVIDYPADRDCDVAIDPVGTVITRDGGTLVVNIPSAGGVDIAVDIICRGLADPVTPATPTTTVAPATPVTTTTAPPAATPTTTAAPAVTPQVESVTATPTQANPSFTG